MTYVSCFYHAFSGAQKVSFSRFRLTLTNKNNKNPAGFPSVMTQSFLFQTVKDVDIIFHFTGYDCRGNQIYSFTVMVLSLNIRIYLQIRTMMGTLTTTKTFWSFCFCFFGHRLCFSKRDLLYGLDLNSQTSCDCLHSPKDHCTDFVTSRPVWFITVGNTSRCPSSFSAAINTYQL